MLQTLVRLHLSPEELSSLEVYPGGSSGRRRRAAMRCSTSLAQRALQSAGWLLATAERLPVTVLQHDALPRRPMRTLKPTAHERRAAHIAIAPVSVAEVAVDERRAGGRRRMEEFLEARVDEAAVLEGRAIDDRAPEPRAVEGAPLDASAVELRAIEVAAAPEVHAVDAIVHAWTGVTPGKPPRTRPRTSSQRDDSSWCCPAVAWIHHSQTVPTRWRSP